MRFIIKQKIIFSKKSSLQNFSSSLVMLIISQKVKNFEIIKFQPKNTIDCKDYDTFLLFYLRTSFIFSLLMFLMLLHCNYIP